ncbi:MAG: hypothetical protein ACI8QQ_002224 [Psychroserpens sp.]|jgi:hypothetical protein
MLSGKICPYWLGNVIINRIDMIRTLLSLIIFIGFLNFESQAQCTNIGNDACTSLAPTIIGNSVTCTPPANQGGRRNFRINNMIAGATYRISNCGSGFDTQMTIRDLGGADVGYNDDNGPACAGAAASIDFVPAADGSYRIQLNRYNCATANELNGDIVVTLLINAAPIYDPCATITNIISCGINTTSTFGAGVGAVAGACTYLADGQENAYTFTPTITGNYSIEQISSTDYVDYYYKEVSAGCNNTGWTCTGAELDGAAAGGSFTLTAGTQYYIMVDPEFTTGGSAVFNIVCPLPPPSNDDPCNAIPLAVNNTCNFATYTNANATATTGVPAPGCAFYSGGDVWFTALVPASGTLIVDTDTGVITDSGMAFYSGAACTSLTLIECDDDGSPYGALMSSITRTGLTPGQTIYIRVWEYGNNNNGTFDICATTVIPCVTPPTDTTPNSCEMVIDEVGTDPFAITPYNPNPSFTLDCNTASVNLATNAQMNETTSYDVIKIPYSIISNLGATITNTPITDDDLWADSPTAIGFPFCFYDNEYDYTLAGANSMLTFDINAPGAPYLLTGTNTPGTSCGYQFSNNLPSTVGNLFEQTIYGVYHDIDPRGLPANAITTRTQGPVGCRLFIAEWNDVPMFGDAATLYSGKMVLYETTNIIEVYIEEKRIENGNSNPWNEGNAIVGLQGDYVGPSSNPANEFVVAPCRNSLDSNWEVTNEAWRFVPNGNSRLTGVEWYIGTDTSGAPDATTNTYTATAPGTYTAISTYSTCAGSTVTLTDEVVVTNSGKIWNGSADDNWYIANNWTPTGVPTSADCVVIPATAVSNGNAPIADVAYLLGIPVPPLPAYGRNLTIMANGYLEVESNTFLDITEWVNVDSSNNGLLVLRDSASLIQDPAATTNINVGSINVQRSVNNLNSYDYVFWSAPVEDHDVEEISPITPANKIFKWLPYQPAGGGVGHHGDWRNPNANELMSIGEGYIARNLGGAITIPDVPALPAATTEFRGRPNNGTINTPISRWTHLAAAGNYTGDNSVANGTTPQDDNWNLIGNPYPSAISYANFISANTFIDGTIYLWTHQNAPSAIADPFYQNFLYNYSNDYVDQNYTGSNPPGFNGNIASGQAFFVQMLDNATTSELVTFTNAMRSNSQNANSQFYRQSNLNHSEEENTIERHRIWLDLITPNDEATSILVGYVEGATLAKDRLYDGFDFEGSSISFYSLIDTDKMSIQGRPIPFMDSDTVPLGVILNDAGTFSIAINTLDGLFDTTDQTIYLEDTYSNTIHNLRLMPYDFTSESGAFNDRFILRYTDDTLSINAYEDANGITILTPKNESVKVISTIGVIDNINIFDIVGRVIFKESQINNSEFIFKDYNLSDGTYVIMVELSNGKRKIQKVVIRQ